MEINKLERDEYGRVHGIIAINKEAGKTSHDIVDEVRRILGTRKVGHAGALDPFASGLLLILVGKATKLSDQYLGMQKQYKARVLFGVKTDSADIEGNIQKVESVDLPENLEDILKEFQPSYEQYVPVYSSVKIEGQKLRVLARKYDQHEIFEKGGDRYVRFFNEAATKEIKLPKHVCQIPEIQLLGTEKIDIMENELGRNNTDRFLEIKEFSVADILVTCSKGTYIRALAEDIGDKFNVPAMLIDLERTRIGDITIAQAVLTSEIPTL